MVHLLNYDTDRPVGQVRVDLRVPSPVRSVSVLSPDPGVQGPVVFQYQNGRLTFQIDRLATYSVAVIATGR